MTNRACYADLAMIKARVGVTDTTQDANLLAALEASSRAIDRYCRRHFSVRNETRYFDGDGSAELWIDDLLSITTLKADADYDSVFEDVLVAADYRAWPYQGYPRLRLDIDRRAGAYSSWPNRGGSVEIAGLWGYGDGESATPYHASGLTVTVTTTTSQAVTASGSGFSAGQTILVGTEQMYLLAVTTTALTAMRGVNGTTAAIQAAVAASIYDYPAEVREACIIDAARLWKRKDSAYNTVLASPEMGMMNVTSGLDADVRRLLDNGLVRVV
jgi:hypothetical protein